MTFVRRLLTALPESLDKSDGDEILNSTSGFNGLPPNVLEIFLPGFGSISRYLSHYCGFDVTYIVSLGLIVLGIAASIRYISKILISAFERYLMATIRINSRDQLYSTVTDWVANQEVTRTATSLLASTSRMTEILEEEDSSDSNSDSDAGGPAYLNFKEWDLKMKPLYQPATGTHSFWHQGRLFLLRRETQQTMMEGFVLRSQITLALSCFGRSTEPIKQLIEDCRIWYLRKMSMRTTVRRPSKQESWDRIRWTTVAKRHSRPVDTVVLGGDQIQRLLDDINEYLHPATSRWYNNRGIPYRRGYLFHGPPGTGKTSLSFAIAGIFGLDIYCISLLEPSLTEEDLASLFSDLPRRCVVLLEDIDSAGLLNRGATQSADNDSRDSSTAASTNADTSTASSGFDMVEDTSATSSSTSFHPAQPQPQPKKKAPPTCAACRAEHAPTAEPSAGAAGCALASLVDALKDARPAPTPRAPVAAAAAGDDKKGISLSGLLNAIDGVASHEGRVLVMTTNRPAALDPALVRPGRIDMRIEFTRATREQIRGLFVRMYVPDAPAAGPAREDAVGEPRKRGAPAAASSSTTLPKKAHVMDGKGGKGIAWLEGLAVKFAEALPEDTLSPAEVQGFLLEHKRDPEKAAEGVATWWASKQGKKKTG